MKTTIATALSVIGVLGAGSAAALVNTQILDGGPAESTASAAVLPPASTVDVSIPELLEARVPELQVDTTVDTTSTTQPEAPKPAAPAPSGYLTSFNVGDAGVVTVDVVDGQLLLVDTEAKPGWQVSKAEQHDDDNEVEVYFSSSTVRVEFEATLIDGQIVPKVSSKSLGTSAAPAKAPTVAPPGKGDDDVHEYDDDEHDDVYEYEDDEHEYEDDEYETTSTKTTSTKTTSTKTTSTKTTSTRTRIATMTDVTGAQRAERLAQLNRRRSTARSGTVAPAAPSAGAPIFAPPAPPTAATSANRPPAAVAAAGRRRQPPATTAKIVTVGASATAVLGMIAGYGIADQAAADKPVLLPLDETASPAPAPASMSPETVPPAAGVPTPTEPPQVIVVVIDGATGLPIAGSFDLSTLAATPPGAADATPVDNAAESAATPATAPAPAAATTPASVPVPTPVAAPVAVDLAVPAPPPPAAAAPPPAAAPQPQATSGGS